MELKKLLAIFSVSILSMLILPEPVIIPRQPASLAEASNACFSAHNFGTGARLMNICISDHGNIVKFESPAGFEQIGQLNTFRDGYSICTNEGRYDAGGLEAGFGFPTVTQPGGPNTFPLTIVRDTADGIFRLTQSFSRDTSKKDVTITMRVRRLSTADCAPDCAPIKLARYFEGDVDNNASTGAYFDRSADAVWETHSVVDGEGRAIGHGLMLSTLNPQTDHATTVHTIAHHNPIGPFPSNQTARGCIVFAGQETTPTASGTGPDLVGRVIHGLGTLPRVGATATIKFNYRRF